MLCHIFLDVCYLAYVNIKDGNFSSTIMLKKYRSILDKTLALTIGEIKSNSNKNGALCLYYSEG